MNLLLCNNATMNGTCKSDEYIKNYLKEKYLVIYWNTQRFQSRQYEADTKVVSESKLIYHPITTQYRTEMYNLIKTIELDLQDTLF